MDSTIPSAAARAQIEKLGLARRADQLAGQLSGGWKQRLALGACILPNPALLLLDEPTAGVDPKARRDFWDEIHHLASRGLTVLVSTHYMDEAERCHKIAYIADGHLLAQGTTAEIIANSGLSTYVVTGPQSRRAGGSTKGHGRRRYDRVLWNGAACRRPRRAET